MRGETTRADGRRSGLIDIAVSDQDRERAFRRARRHTLFVKLMKMVLPAIALVSLGYYGIALIATSMLAGSNITAGNMTVDPTNLMMADPRYSGFGKDGSEYKVHAKNAVMDLRMSAPVKLNLIDGEIAQPSGVVTHLKAKWGTYDQKQELLELHERIDVDATNGMMARLTRATVHAKEGRIMSGEPVLAETTTGKITAKAMTLNTKTRQAQFSNAVRVTLKPTQPTRVPSEDGATPAKRDAQAFGIDTTSKEPVVVTSRRLDVDDNARIALFREDVVARQGEASLAAPELDVLYAGRADIGGGAAAATAAATPGGTDATKLKAIRARGGVVMLNKGDRADSATLDYDAERERIVLAGNVVMMQVPDRRATAETVVLEQKEDTALLTGSVVITQGRNVLRGESLAVDRKVGTAKLASPAQDGRPAGRISTLLYQNQTQKPAAAKAKAQSADEEEGMPGTLGTNFKADPDAPIDVEALVLDINDRKHIAVYTGKVVAKQGTFVVQTEEMTARYQGDTGLVGNLRPDASQPARAGNVAGGGPGGSQLKKIEARRGVVVTGTEGQQATGEWADFDVAANTIIMGGNVVVSQGKQIVRAPAGMRLFIDLATGVTRFEPEPGAAAKAGPKTSGAFATSVTPNTPGLPGCPQGAVCKGGRLEAIFYPNQVQEKAKKGAGGASDAANGKGKAPKAGSAWTSTTNPSRAP